MAKKGLRKGIGTVTAIAIGVAAALIMSFALTMVFASLLENETIPINSGDTVSVGIRVLASAVGALVAVLLAGKNKLIVGFGCGAVYFILLLIITVFAFGGEYEGFLGSLLTVAAGSAMAIGVTMLGNKKPVFGKKIPRYR